MQDELFTFRSYRKNWSIYLMTWNMKVLRYNVLFNLYIFFWVEKFLSSIFIFFFELLAESSLFSLLSLYHFRLGVLKKIKRFSTWSEMSKNILLTIFYLPRAYPTGMYGRGQAFVWMGTYSLGFLAGFKFEDFGMRVLWYILHIHIGRMYI